MQTAESDREKLLNEMKERLKSTKGEKNQRILTLEIACMELSRIPYSSSRDKLLQIQTELKNLFPKLEFTKDIDQLVKSLEIPKSFTIENSDDWQDLLLSGTEIAGSCQAITGEPRHNKALMGYCMDGKNRILAIKDSSGKLIARSMIRLFFDSENKPAMFFDHVYPNSTYEPMLLEAAKAKARSLGCSLYQYGYGYGEGDVLHSISSRAPYEYMDAGGQGVTGGSFEVHTKKIPLGP